MESTEPNIFSQAADHAIDALAHLGSRLVRECDCQYTIRRHTVRQEVGDAACEHLRLARSRACHDEQGTVDMRDSFLLHGIQTLKNIHCINLSNPRSI